MTLVRGEDKTVSRKGAKKSQRRGERFLLKLCVFSSSLRLCVKPDLTTYKTPDIPHFHLHPESATRSLLSIQVQASSQSCSPLVLHAISSPDRERSRRHQLPHGQLQTAA